jgi:hypothetical protein
MLIYKHVFALSFYVASISRFTSSFLFYWSLSSYVLILFWKCKNKVTFLLKGSAFQTSLSAYTFYRVTLHNPSLNIPKDTVSAIPNVKVCHKAK